MPITLLEAKNWLKSSRGLTRDKEDGLVDDTILLEAIHDGIKTVAKDCSLLPTTQKLPLIAGQYEYPLPEQIVSLRAIYREDTNGRKLPLIQVTQEQFQAFHDADSLTAQNPAYFAYPIYRGRRYQFFVKAPANYDFLPTSRVTSGTVRTITDSGANFGRTLSGDRISPGDIVHNDSADSYGYIKILDMITSKTIKTCAAETDSSEIVAAATDWKTLGVKVDDLICYPSTGVPTTYAFVTGMSGGTLSYTDIRGTLSAFTQALNVKVGVANKIRLNTDAPHRGLRSGSYNTFSVAAATATMTGTTFSDTRCTGSSTTGASAGQEAIASGGSHGYITGVGSNYVDVTCWIGGVPGDGEVVTIQTCDEYHIETRPMIQEEVWLRPTPSVSDAIGAERLWLDFDIEPYLPTKDYEYIDIPVKYKDAFTACIEWKVSRQTGTHKPRAIAEYKSLYDNEIAKFEGDIHVGATGDIMTVYKNAHPNAGIRGGVGTRSGHIYDTAGMVNEQNS